MVLAPAHELAAGALKPWFALAWADMWGPGEVDESETADSWVGRGGAGDHWVATVDTVAVGIVACREDDHALTLTALAVAAAHRNVGVGAEIVALLEQRSRAQRARALFPLANGYAFYFWLRSGYRPEFARGGTRALNAVVRDLH